MGTLSLLGLGTLAGLHGALYGAYKDSPHESFLFRRFIREVAFALSGALALPVLFPLVRRQSAFTVYLALFALTRIVTEFWKLFLRVEPQDGYRIPTQMHCVVGVVQSPVVRFLFGIGFLASIYGCYAAFRLIPGWMPAALNGSLVGLGIGTAEAIAGGYKDGTIEGFSWRKFFKSPVFGVAVRRVVHTSPPLRPAVCAHVARVPRAVQPPELVGRRVDRRVLFCCRRRQRAAALGERGADAASRCRAADLSR
jgi:hypothetical protein